MKGTWLGHPQTRAPYRAAARETAARVAAAMAVGEVLAVRAAAVRVVVGSAAAMAHTVAVTVEWAAMAPAIRARAAEEGWAPAREEAKGATAKRAGGSAQAAMAMAAGVGSARVALAAALAGTAAMAVDAVDTVQKAAALRAAGRARHTRRTCPGIALGASVRRPHPCSARSSQRTRLPCYSHRRRSLRRGSRRSRCCTRRGRAR